MSYGLVQGPVLARAGGAGPGSGRQGDQEPILAQATAGLGERRHRPASGPGSGLLEHWPETACGVTPSSATG
jgi:hypothetical protein